MGRMVATQAFRTAGTKKDPRGVHVAAGQVKSKSFVKGREALFVDEDDWNGPVVEQATATPGEVRVTPGGLLAAARAKIDTKDEEDSDGV